MIIREKVKQAIQILKEYEIDCWMTFVRESSIMHDPMLDFLVEADVTWHSAFILNKTGQTYALVGQMDRQTIEDLGVYDHVLSYVKGIKEQLCQTIKQLNPAKIAVNYSRDSEISDGLTHGMYLTLYEFLSEIEYADRIVSAEKVTSSLRARKTPTELARIRKAIYQTMTIIQKAASYIAPGRSEKEIAAFMIAEVEKRGLDFAWEKSHCPAVFTGPETAEAHYKPTERKVERGHILNMDFGVKVDGYCSDIQRTFYVLREEENEPPQEVQKGFETIVTAIEKARQSIRPGVQGLAVDKAARDYITSQGFEEFPHALGHQVGRFAHDGTALLGPAWEKYAQKPFLPLEPGMVFTLEPRLKVPNHGIVTIEEMVVVREEGAEFLAPPQTELLLIK